MHIGIGVRLGASSLGWGRYSVLGFAPGMIADEAASRYLADGLAASFPDVYDWSVTGNAVMTDVDGLLKWAPHNLAYNSETPAFNAITVVIGAQYTCKCQGTGSISLSGATTATVTEAAPVTFTATTTALGHTIVGSLDRIWTYRSDLGGMAPVPGDMRVDGLVDYVVTPTTAAVYLPRRNHHINAPKIYWIGDSFLNSNGPADETALLIEDQGRIGYTVDGVGGSTMAEQATRFASASPVYYRDTLVILDGGLTDSAAAAIAAIDDMVGRLTHDRWLYVESPPLNEASVATTRASTATIRAHVGERHFVTTYDEARALGDNSPTDNDQIALGLWPVSLTISAADFHPNQAGYEFLASRVHAKLQENSWIGSEAAVVKGGILIEPTAVQNLLPRTMLDATTPTGWSVLLDTGARELTTRYGAPAMRFTASGQREVLLQSVTFAASTTYTLSARVQVVSGTPAWGVVSVGNLSDATGDVTGEITDIDREGYVSITFTTGADTAGDIRFGIGVTANATGEVLISELMLNTGTIRQPWVPTLGAAVTRPAESLSVKYEALPVSGGMPSFVSLQMDGLMSYADTNTGTIGIPLYWATAFDNRIQIDLRDNTGTGQIGFLHYAGGALDTVLSGVDAYAPGHLVPFNVASGHSIGFLNGAVDGTALTEDVTPVAQPTLATTDIRLAYEGGPTIINMVRVWAEDITDAGRELATA